MFPGVSERLFLLATSSSMLKNVSAVFGVNSMKSSKRQTSKNPILQIQFNYRNYFKLAFL
jgi:hypothetical protein